MADPVLPTGVYYLYYSYYYYHKYDVNITFYRIVFKKGHTSILWDILSPISYSYKSIDHFLAPETQSSDQIRCDLNLRRPSRGDIDLSWGTWGTEHLSCVCFKTG